MRRASCLALALALLVPAMADGANRRIAISDYSWSDSEIEIDRGEHVTWYWTGPDLMHSVTGDSANAAGLDSDPGTNQPIHDLGDSFQLSFDQPGTYELNCKLHSTVRGQITVSATPGDPVSEPDPVPATRVDLEAPTLRDVRLDGNTIGRRGTRLAFSLGERARIAAEIFSVDEGGRRDFAGYQTWRGYVGYNGVRIGARARHFRPRSGDYVALVTATDSSNNVSRARRIRFRIR